MQEKHTEADTSKTRRLTLVPLAFKDAEALFPIAQDTASIEDFQHTAKTLEDVEEWVRDAAALAWTIRLDDSIVGMVEVDISKDAIAEIGYFIDAKHQGKGCTTEALRAVIDWLLTSTKVHRVEAGITARNAASRRVVEKLGFTLEGISRKNWLWDDEWHDSANYAMLREEWSAR